jgi:hypothetical protein
MLVWLKYNDLAFMANSMREKKCEQTLITTYVVNGLAVPVKIGEEFLLCFPFVYAWYEKRQPAHAALTLQTACGPVIGGVNMVIYKGSTIKTRNDSAFERHSSSWSDFGIDKSIHIALQRHVNNYVQSIGNEILL